MKPSKLPALKFFALLFLLPGLAGLIVSATISTHYLDTMPRWPAPQQQRIVPREIHGTTIYQTIAENRQLSTIEYSSVGVFLVGLVIGVVYLEKWGAAQSRAAQEDAELAGHVR
jgi:hypothetical protein